MKSGQSSKRTLGSKRHFQKAGRQTGSVRPHAIQAAPALASFPRQTCHFRAVLCCQLPVLRRGRRPGPRVLRGDGGDQKWPEEVQAEEDPEESDSTGEERLCVCGLFDIAESCFILQGIVKLEHPCIHVDFPLILCEV